MNKIFISIATKEKVLGEIFSKTIDHVFDGKLTCSLLELKPGDEWKRKIKQNLNECNILVSFLTPFYTERPWAYVEWAAFWFVENKHTILMLPEQNSNQISHLFEPFHDVQAAFIEDEESIRLVLQQIQDITGLNGRNVNSEGNKLSQNLVDAYNELLLKRKSDKFSIYKTNLDNLPFYDTEIKEIALHFYNIHDSETFLKISEKIISEEIKYEIAKFILSKKDLTAFNSFIALIDSNDKLLALLKYVVYYLHQQDTSITREIIEKIKNTSEESLIIFIKDLIRNGLLKSSLFEYMTSTLELDSSKRKIYIYLAERNIDALILDRILQLLESSNVEKVKIAKYYVEKDNAVLYLKILKGINNNAELYKLFRVLNEKSYSLVYLKHIIEVVNNSSTLKDMLSYVKERNLDSSLINEIEIKKSKLID